ncbi:MAG TPA: hypothetical protein VG365_08835 [Solirubrobacteraceae bacterium]|nr:hypothetical protein [Solirubrobacteraceae bacterium]
MSFFDEADEPPRTQPRRTTRTARGSAPRRRTGGRRPPGDQQAIQVRRAIALGALLVIVLLVALGIHSCDVSSTQSALQNYTSNVSSLMMQSAQNGKQLFSVLSGAAAKGNPTQVQTQVNQALADAKRLLGQARSISVPDQVRAGNQNVVMALSMRRDGISNIANEIQPALGTSANQSNINKIAAETARFYASDVLYKDYAAAAIAGAVNAAGVRFSPLSGGQFVPDVQWLVPSYIASQLHVAGAPTSPTKVAPGVHGHKLDSVSVGGTPLTLGSTATVPAKPAPSFTLTFTNTGTNKETNVVCKVTVNGTSVSGQAVVPQTVPGNQATCTVPLNASPPAGTHTVVAGIQRVPGEKSVVRNSQSFTITFQ